MQSGNHHFTAADKIFVHLGIQARGREAFHLLLTAADYARERSTSGWNFAVELATLRRAGLTNNDLRWLIMCGYMTHGIELPSAGSTRRFNARDNLTFRRRSCFLLTEEGLGFCRQLLTPSGSLAEVVASQPQNYEVGSIQIPKWDRDRLELRWADLIVKQFKAPAANQETILAALEEEGWPVRIDDPLPPHPNQDPKRRLHDTIHSLNRNQKNNLIRFEGDGMGQGVRWRLRSTADRARGWGSQLSGSRASA